MFTMVLQMHGNRPKKCLSTAISSVQGLSRHSSTANTSGRIMALSQKVINSRSSTALTASLSTPLVPRLTLLVQ